MSTNSIYQPLQIDNDEYFMRLAFQEAQKAYDKKEVPIGAVVVARHRVIARAYNQVEELQDATAHAEMLAISAAFVSLRAKYLQECTLYVSLEPCIMCACAANWAKLSRLVFAAPDDKLGYRLFSPSPLHPRTYVSSDVLAAEGQKIIKKFFVDLRK